MCLPVRAHRDRWSRGFGTGEWGWGPSKDSVSAGLLAPHCGLITNQLERAEGDGGGVTAPASRLCVGESGSPPASATLRDLNIYILGEGGYYLLFLSYCLPLPPEGPERERGVRSPAERRGSERVKGGNFAGGGRRGDLDFHQSPGVCLRSPGRRGRLRRAAEFTDESEFFSSAGGVGSGGPGKPGGEARGGLAVPAAVEISKDLARLGGGVGRAGGLPGGSAEREAGRGGEGRRSIARKGTPRARCLGGSRASPRTHAEGDGDAAEPAGATPRRRPPPSPRSRNPGARLLQGETTMAVARDLLPGHLP